MTEEEKDITNLPFKEINLKKSTEKDQETEIERGLEKGIEMISDPEITIDTEYNYFKSGVVYLELLQKLKITN